MRWNALVALSLFIVFSTPAVAEKRVALVVGNSGYQNVANLDNPKNDALLIAETLGRLGFTLVGGGAQVDLDKPKFDLAIQNFGNQLMGADVGLFYYAGHGLQVRGSNYLVPITANPRRETDIDFQMVDVALILRQMEGSGTKLNLVLLDACRNNPFGGRGLRSADGGLAQMRAPEGTLISYATQPGNIALDGDDGHSPYTRALVQTMQKPRLDVFQTFNEVGLVVKSATANSQQPWLSSSPIAGPFYFAGLSTTEPKPAPAAPLPVAPSAITSQALLEQRAIAFLTEYMNQARADETTFMNFARQIFDDPVNFYGKMSSRADVLKDKERYVARWPLRTY
jgi:uncharacterized caspase-like protein